MAVQVVRIKRQSVGQVNGKHLEKVKHWSMHLVALQKELSISQLASTTVGPYLLYLLSRHVRLKAIN